MDLILTTSQKLVLSQRMLQSAEILQMSSQELVEYVKELSIENPVVEYEETLQEQNKFDLVKKKLEWLDASDEQNKVYYHEEKDEESNNDNWNFKENSGENLEDYLLSQINILPIKKSRLEVAQYLVECINSNGYLEDTIENIALCLKTEEIVVKEMLSLIQSLEPLGVGARNLKECLLIQLKSEDLRNPLAEKIIENDLETLGKNQLHVIAKKYKKTIDEVIEACNLIKGLNPKPGNSFSCNKTLEYITPDAVVVKEKEEYKIILNDYYFPKISINTYYKNIVKEDSSDKAKDYVCDKIRQAEWAIKCISKRNTTLLKTIEVIVELQNGFFDNGPGNLKPLKLMDVAERINMHESTVSRAVRDKYLQCSWGVFALCSFFSTGVCSRNAEGLEGKTTPETIKLKMKGIIENEDKQSPLSDREITEKLNEKGIEISRRTVAKYREAMGILGATGRRAFEM